MENKCASATYSFDKTQSFRDYQEGNISEEAWKNSGEEVFYINVKYTTSDDKVTNVHHIVDAETIRRYYHDDFIDFKTFSDAICFNDMYSDENYIDNLVCNDKAQGV